MKTKHRNKGTGKQNKQEQNKTTRKRNLSENRNVTETKKKTQTKYNKTEQTRNKT